MKKHLNITVYGKVQGVYFRASTKAKADEMGVCGTVENKADGSVFIRAEAPHEVLERFLSWCEEGPENAVVEKIEKHQKGLQHFEAFNIIS